MRPLRIEVEGFSAFRAPAVVDLTDVDLFAFVGPTGAGKSSLIDAMVFALYGSVPRYGSDRLVHPVITQGKPEARVRLDFELGGRRHTAVRVVRRTKAGATTKEARLERGDEVLAADARAVTEVATELLGLDLEQFTKCVVLPQGAFAALLHDTSAKRQDLLVKLLDLGVYEQVASAARRRVQAADQRLAVLDGQLAQLGEVTDGDVAAAEGRVAATSALLDRLDTAAPALAALDDRLRVVDAEVEARREQLDLVTGVSVPADVGAVADALRDATAALAAAEDAERAAVDAVEAAVAVRGALGDPAAIRAAREALAEVATLTERVAAGEAKVAEQETTCAGLDVAAEAATADERAAAEARDRVRLAHAAADVARHLHPGDDCPVCGSTVTTLPAVDDAELAAADAALDAARQAGAAASAAAREAHATLTGYRTRLESLAESLAAAQARAAGAPDPAELDRQLAAIEAADRDVDAARRSDQQARAAASEARRVRDEAVAAEARARTALAATRDRVAAQGPPPLGGDLADDWSRLAGWCAERAAELDEALAAAAARREAVVAERTAQVDELVAAAAAAGVAVATPAALRDACVRAAAEATSTLQRLRDQQARSAALRDEQAAVADQRSVHDAVASELHPKRFEAWLLEEALTALVAGASERLEQLSSGRYAMALDDKQAFEVVDHANADERRLARTLSGGETFLASLALALALAERVSELAPGGGATLDAIFLDEGFGTLDPDTLDVVATAIEELGASGRMVGVVSHVAELAERVPTRFEVRRELDTSCVVRVDA